ncbi:CRISPR-associated protein, APE2256 family [Staphylothermus hellenicus DSM 12710]|uniref:CRISPR-associated protein, APE2256 family n=1 Tax=Staphylothermus hellenicus (strain DSM 12710 / JCM 10830 / BK20S6-10-b1 / P8) TaxID=591019 RepID=D7DAW2_STAHD|nr:CRISPR-associated protein, APE2256 family [Staphylothermus hellenicus DSM 12710]
MVTVGTSIIRNASFHESVEAGVRERLAKWSMAPPHSGEDVEAGNRAVPSSKEFREVLGFVSGSPRRASAELNAFIGYLERLVSRGIDGVSHYLVLFGSDTGAGWFSTRILEEYLGSLVGQDLSRTWGVRGHFIGGVEAYRVRGLGVNFQDGILNLLGKVKKIVISMGKGYDRVLANLTGGFKPESAAILVVAGMLGIDTVYYIHEAMREVAEIPVIPLTIEPNAKKILENALENNIGGAEQKLLEKLGLPLTGKKLTPWSKKLLETLLYP